MRNGCAGPHGSAGRLVKIQPTLVERAAAVHEKSWRVGDNGGGGGSIWSGGVELGNTTLR